MIVRSPYPDLTIPEMAFDRFVLHKATALGDKPALVDVSTGYTLTYAQLERRVAQFASGLVKRGFRKGDVMAIFSPNQPDYAVAFLGVAAAGGASATINPLYTADEARRPVAGRRGEISADHTRRCWTGRGRPQPGRASRKYSLSAQRRARCLSTICSTLNLLTRRMVAMRAMTWWRFRFPRGRPAAPKG